MKKFFGYALTVFASCFLSSCGDKPVNLDSTSDVKEALEGTWSADLYQCDPFDTNCSEGTFELSLGGDKPSFTIEGHADIPDEDYKDFSTYDVVITGSVTNYEVDDNHVEMKLEIDDAEIKGLNVTDYAQKTLNATEEKIEKDFNKHYKKGEDETFSMTIKSLKGDRMNVRANGERVVFKK